MFETWTCHICGEERPDACISVSTRDTSADYNLPVGTMKQNVSYCNDKKECTEKAKTHSFFKKKKNKNEQK